ncbi:MAG: glycosyltransferase family 4 protein [Herpetosiphonaceae bacterium]|nr:glycosyltransferase family 4 protein [Herpetosiphonaceae bacterium]
MHAQGNDAARAHPIHLLEVLGAAIVGGMEQYVDNLIRRLPARQFRVTCLCPYESAFTQKLRAHGCAVFIAPLRDEPPWRSIQLAVELIRHHEVDLIHAHLPNAHVVAGLAGGLMQVPVVATVHGMNLTTHELGISRTTGTHLMVVCQEAYTQGLAMGLPPERLTLVPNGVDTKLFMPREDRAARRAALGLPQDVQLVGFVGRLAPEKGPDNFIRAAATLHHARPDVHFAVVGDGAMDRQLREMVANTGLHEYVHFLGLREDTRELYPAFDVLAHTSRSEGMPLVLLEAMACGLPVVALGVGGVAEVVEVGTTGMLLGPGDWEGISIALSDLLARPERIAEMGHAARERAIKHFEIATTIQRSTELFRRLVTPPALSRDVLKTKVLATGGRA